MLKAIVVDDEKMTRETLFNNIPWELLGFTVVEQAQNGIQALELARQIVPDVVLCDIRMPKMNGIELGKELRNLYPDCKLIFLSAYSDKDYLKSAIKLSAVDYIEKPLILPDIIELISTTAFSCFEEKKRSKESSSLVKQKLAVDLCNPHFDAILIENKLPFPMKGEYRTAIIKFNFQTNNKADLESRMNDFGLKVLAGLYGHDQIILHFFIEDSKMEETIFLALENFIQSSRLTDTKVFISLGPKVPGLDRIYSSYDTASALLGRLFFSDYYQMVWELDPPGDTYLFEENISDKFYHLLKENKREYLFAQIDTMMNDIRKCSRSPANYIKNGFFSIFLKMNRFLEEQHLSTDEFMEESLNEKKFIWEVISSFSTLVEMEHYLKQHTQIIFDQLNNEANQHDAAHGIKKYIQEHFQDINLSINSIAQRFFLSSNYASFIFKRENHMTINQYITAVRMDKAKSLLVNKKNTLIDIAAMVGYSDSKYFARVFKKETGMTTSEYREGFMR
ncbi:MAG TPA: response regulator [Bacilli bacterium]